MRHTRLAHIASGAVTAASFTLLAGGPVLADHHIGGPGDIGSNPRPAAPQLTISTPEVIEGTGGTNELTFTLELDKPAAGGEGIKFFTQDTVGTANPLEDHAPVLTYVTFAAGETEQNVAVPVVTDNVPEANETVMVGVSNPTGLTVMDDTSSGVIVDDDTPSRGGNLGTGRGTPAPGDGQTVVIGGGPSPALTSPSVELDAPRAGENADQEIQKSSALDIWMLAGVSVLLAGIYVARTRLARRRM